MPPKGGGGDKSKQFWGAIVSQKQDTIRWCFNYGGIMPTTRDDNGYCGIHLAAKSNKVRSLESILDHVRRSIMSRGGGDTRAVRGKGPAKKRSYEELDCKDEEHGLTAFMWACKHGYYECAQLLYENGVTTDLKSDEGKTALQYAKENKREDIVKWFERGFEEEEEEEGEEQFPFLEGETEGERRKRIKAIKSGQEKFSALSKKDDKPQEEEEEAEEEDADPGPAPMWEEIKQCKSGESHTWTCDLVCLRQQTQDTQVDPALWYCKHVNNLKLRLPPKVLTELPPDISRLKNLTTLIVSHNALTSLPEDMFFLKQLKNLEFTDNQVAALPDAIGGLTKLEVLDACRNKLSNITAISSLHNLVTLKLDQNQVSSLSGLDYKKCTRLTSLSASHNGIKELEPKLGRLAALTSLNLANNALKELPVELSDFSEKVLVHLNLDDNPLKDSKVKKILEKGRAPIKELIAHLEKEKQTGGKQRKKKQKAASESEDEEDEGEAAQDEEPEQEEPEPEPEPVKTPQAGGGGGKNKKKGGKGKGGGPAMTEAQKEAARAAAMAKLGMAPPAAKAAAAPKAAAAAVPAAEMGALTVKEEQEEEALDLGEECDEEDLDAFYTAAPDSEEDEEDLDDFLNDTPKESATDREARIAKEMENRKKAAAAAAKAKEKEKKEHEEWLASMDDETRARWVAEQERKQRAAEEALREEEEERERRRLEDAKRRGGGSDGGSAAAATASGKNDKIELKWSWSSEKGGMLVSEPQERKGPKKPVREIQLRFPKKKVGVIIGKAGVNIKIIEGKSKAKVNIHKPKVGEEEDDETLVTIKGSSEQIDRACETINLVFAQFSAAMKARRAAAGK